MSTYNESGDLVTKAGQVFRQVGWQINGGVNDGIVLTNREGNDKALESLLSLSPHGGYSPVYIEVGTE